MRKIILRLGVAMVMGMVISGCEVDADSSHDTIPPELVLLGDNPMTVVRNCPCKDPGATAMDNLDGYVHIEVEGHVDVSTVGTYRVVYRATDSAGNVAEAVRVIRVVSGDVDDQKPIITLIGSAEVTLFQHANYKDKGATAIDNVDGDITSSLQITNSVKIDMLGDYTVVYNVADSSGNSAVEVIRVVHVIADPSLFLLGIRLDQAGHFRIPTKNANLSMTRAGAGYISNFVVNTYDYSIDCDNDGIFEEHNITGDYVCEYEEAGDYTVAIRGVFPQIYFHHVNDARNLSAVVQWGSVGWKSMEYAFEGCSQMRIEATDKPDLSNVTDMSYMFHGASSLEGGVKGWDVSSVDNMEHMFDGASAFDGNVSDWNTSRVQNMRGMFWGASAFNQPLATWNVNGVEDFSYMFKYALNFNQDISSWDTAFATNMEYMFYHAETFSNNDLRKWNVGRVYQRDSFSTKWGDGNREPLWN